MKVLYICFIPIGHILQFTSTVNKMGPKFGMDYFESNAQAVQLIKQAINCLLNYAN